MKIELSQDDLIPLIEQVVSETIDRLEADRSKLNGRLGFPEPEAAALLGVQPYTLRDCRLRGEITAVKIGKRYIYSRDALLMFLGERRAK